MANTSVKVNIGKENWQLLLDEFNKVRGEKLAFPNVKNLWDYPAYNASQDSTALINQAFADLTALGGGKLMLPMGTVKTNAKITIPLNITVEGFGAGMTVLALSPGVNDDVVSLDTHQNCGIRFLTIKGNAWSGGGQNGKDGLIIGRPGINTAINEGNMPNVNVSNLEIRDIGGNGFHCYYGTWIYYISKIAVRYNTGYGMWIESTDNMYDTIEATANGSYGVYVTGSNNRLSNMKIIFNGRGQQTNGKFLGTGDNITSAGVRINSGTRNTLVNIESQENYGHGFVFDGAKDADLIGLLADKNGYSVLAATDGASITGTPNAIGYYFMNGCARLTGMLKATNFNTSLVTQIAGYSIDSTCQNVSLEYEQDATQTGLSSNLSYTCLVTTADTRALSLANSQYNDLLTSGLSLTNQITAYDTSNFSLTTTFVKAGYTISGNDIYGSTEWTNTPRIGQVGNKAITAGNIYLVRVKVKPDINNYYLRFKAMYNDGAYENINSLEGRYVNTAYTELSFVIKAPRAGNILVFVEDKIGTNNATQGAFHIAEMSVIDITSVISAKYHPKTADLLAKKNYFVGTRVFT